MAAPQAFSDCQTIPQPSLRGCLAIPQELSKSAQLPTLSFSSFIFILKYIYILHFVFPKIQTESLLTLKLNYQHNFLCILLVYIHARASLTIMVRNENPADGNPMMAQMTTVKQCSRNGGNYCTK
jgi:hypothetical protein